MKNKYWKYIIATLLGATTGLLSSSWAVVSTSNPPLNINSQELGLSGPFSFGINYDSLNGAMLNAQWTQALSSSTALGLLGEYGKNQSRLNGTFGYQPYSAGLLKFSAEYLSQLLPFDFDSGNINQRVSQSAFGVNFQHDMNQAVLQSLNIGAYWAKSPNTSLSSLDFISNEGLNYTNQRHIAGAVSDGFSIGGTVDISSITSLDAALNYDSVNYNTQWVASSVNNTRGIGETLKLNQIINENTKFSIEASNRALYNTYGLDVNYSPSLLRKVGMTMAASFQRLVSSNATPSSNTYGLQFNFLGNAGVMSPRFSLDKAPSLENLTQWIKTPAVYMQRVMAVAEQVTTLNAPSINSISPQVGLLSGNNTVNIQGANFVSGTKVIFGTITAPSLSLISSHQISVTVPAVDTPQTVKVTLINPDGKESVSNNAYTYIVSQKETLPILTSIASSSGSILGGDKVTLTGKNFTDIKTVTFDGISATHVTLVNHTTITAVTPKHAAGAVNVAISEAAGDAMLSKGYIYRSTAHAKIVVTNAPTVTNVSPNTGTGGTIVTITGTNFDTTSGNTSVSFGPVNASIISINTTSITVFAPAIVPAQTVDIRVTTIGGGTSITSPVDQFTYIQLTPIVVGVSPNTGSTTGGESITIIGSDLGNASSVKFGETTATIVQDTPTTIIATSPVGTAGTVDVTVTTLVGTSPTSANDHYTYIAPPTVSGVSPSSGPTSGGTNVTITGTNFTGATAVSFGGFTATTYHVVSSTSITATVPAASAPGTVDITVTTVGGTSTTSSADQYTYVAAPTVTAVSPTSGPIAGGTTVTINGTNLSGATSVKFGTTNATIVSDTSTFIVATAPTASAGTIDITVTTAGGTSVTSSADQFTYETPVNPPSDTSGSGLSNNQIVAASAVGFAAVIGHAVTDTIIPFKIPRIASVSPNNGVVGKSTQVVIKGEGFAHTKAVKFGDMNATHFKVDSDTQITATSPSNLGTVHITVINDKGSSVLSSKDEFTYHFN